MQKLLPFFIDKRKKKEYNKGMNNPKIVIVGGGASGMLCALWLAKQGQQNITLLERGERLGRKLSATGNGQGNITNVNFGVEHYFSDDLEKVEKVLSTFTADELIAFFTSLGGLFLPDSTGRVYPTGRQASALTDLLRFALAETRVEVLMGVKVDAVKKTDKGFTLLCGEKAAQADVLVLATGGKAAKNFGTDGWSFEAVKSLGHTVTELYPSLVQLKTDTTDIKGLKGIRADCILKAVQGGKTIAEKRGDLLFTDFGVSGNAVFFLSSFITDKKGVSLEIDFLPDVDEERLKNVLINKQKNHPKMEILSGVINNQLGRSLVNKVKKEGEVTPEKLAKEVKRFSLPVLGSLNFDLAQVTKGGVPMSEVNDDLSSKKRANLYLLGELLNVDGECGGYNLQWAFSSAVRAANAIVKKYQQLRG